jgi:hypothetical protein
MPTPSYPPIPNRRSHLPAWECRLPVKYVVAASPGPMSLAVEVEIESTDTAVRRCTQALIDCGATGCFIDIEWAKLNNIPTRPLTKPIPVCNVDGTANDAGTITDIADVVLRYKNHSEHTQLAVTRLGKQSLILGYNWLRNHNPEINWQTKDVKMSQCPVQCSTCRVEDKRCHTLIKCVSRCAGSVLNQAVSGCPGKLNYITYINHLFKDITKC